MPHFSKHGRIVRNAASICCACSRPGWITQVGSDCDCGGVFFRPWYFEFWRCPACNDDYDPLCNSCHGYGSIPEPRHDLTTEEVEAELAAMRAARARVPTPVFQPEPRPYVWKVRKAKRRRKSS